MTEIPKTADAVVIGGGILGVCTAYALAMRGVKNIVLLEKESLASGSTGKTSGFIRCHYTVPEVVKMAVKSAKYFSDFKEIVGEGETDFKKTGMFILVSPEYARNLEMNVLMQQERGVSTAVLLSPKSSSKCFYISNQRINLDNVGAICYEREAGYADGPSTVLSFADHCKRMGVKICQGAEAVSICQEIDGVFFERCPTRRASKRTIVGVNFLDKSGSHYIKTPLVINATGPWAKKIGLMAGIDLPLEIRRHPVAIVKNPSDFNEPLPMVTDFSSDMYFRREGKLLTLTGQIAFASEKLVANPKIYDEKVSFEEVVNFAEKLSKRIPKMEDCMPLQGSSYTGLMTLTPDGYPILGKVDEIEGFYLACGGSGHCFKLGPVIGEMIADEIIGKKPEFDIEMFNLRRFKENALIKGQYEYNIRL